MTEEPTQLFAHYEAILSAFHAVLDAQRAALGLGAAEPLDAFLEDVLPAIRERVPDTTDEEILKALRWSRDARILGPVVQDLRRKGQRGGQANG
jgi:hypothetical protein